jgi:hypothetical protein
MKKLLLVVVLSSIAAFCSDGYSQGLTAPPLTLEQPTPTIQSSVQGLWDAFLTGNSKWLFEAHGLYAPKLQNKYGGGAGVFYPLNDYVYTGLRIDWVDGGFWMPSGNAGLQLPIRPFNKFGGLAAKLVLTPFAYVGIGIPLSGATVGDITIPGSVQNNNGQATVITGYGLAVSVWQNKKGNVTFSLIGDREKWAGFEGSQYRAGCAFRISY